MTLTREEAIKKTRNMWNWIADKTLERKAIVGKLDYFEENGIKDIPSCACYLCEYDSELSYKCKRCPLEFLKNNNDEIMPCCDDDSPYSKWYDACAFYEDYELAAKYAREIVNLPEK